MQNPIIVALDNVNRNKAIEIAGEIKGAVWGFKVNDLFVEYGPDIVKDLSMFGNVMLDLKIYDIPNTASNIGSKIAHAMPGAQIVTAHAHGSPAMLVALNKMLPGKVAAVTVLTSFDEETYKKTHNHVHNESPFIPQMVEHLYHQAWGAGCAYVVCSGKELDILPREGPSKIIPGIRPSWHQKSDDQKRTLTPKEAIDKGANFLVIGRPILEAGSPMKAVHDTCEEIGL